MTNSGLTVRCTADASLARADLGRFQLISRCLIQDHKERTKDKKQKEANHDFILQPARLTTVQDEADAGEKPWFGSRMRKPVRSTRGRRPPPLRGWRGCQRSAEIPSPN